MPLEYLKQKEEAAKRKKAVEQKIKAWDKAKEKFIKDDLERGNSKTRKDAEMRWSFGVNWYYKISEYLKFKYGKE